MKKKETRSVDDLGRIVIPKEIRKSLNIKNGDTLKFSILKDKKIILETEGRNF